MRTLAVTLYEFSELGDSSKTNAKIYIAERFNDCHSEEIEHDIMEELKEEGWSVVKGKIYFQCGYVQSDFLDFKFDSISDNLMEQIAQQALGKKEYRRYKRFKENGLIRIYIGNTDNKHGIDVSIENPYNLDCVDKWITFNEGEIMECVLDVFNDTKSQMHKLAYEQFESFNSNEYVNELCEVNNYKFYEDGELYN